MPPPINRVTAPTPGRLLAASTPWTPCFPGSSGARARSGSPTRHDHRPTTSSPRAVTGPPLPRQAGPTRMWPFTGFGRAAHPVRTADRSSGRAHDGSERIPAVAVGRVNGAAGPRGPHRLTAATGRDERDRLVGDRAAEAPVGVGVGLQPYRRVVQHTRAGSAVRPKGRGS